MGGERREGVREKDEVMDKRDREGERKGGAPLSPHLSVMAGFPALAVLVSLLYCGLQPSGYGEALGYLYTLPVQHKAARPRFSDHKIIPVLRCVFK